MGYIYESPVGIFSISPDNGRWLLKMDDELYGSYFSPQQAADDVYVHSTGCYDWDARSDQSDDPTDLSEWEIVKC